MGHMHSIGVSKNNAGPHVLSPGSSNYLYHLSTPRDVVKMYDPKIGYKDVGGDLIGSFMVIRLTKKVMIINQYLLVRNRDTYQTVWVDSVFRCPQIRLSKPLYNIPK
jgi:hypothetical protein